MNINRFSNTPALIPTTNLYNLSTVSMVECLYLQECGSYRICGYFYDPSVSTQNFITKPKAK